MSRRRSLSRLVVVLAVLGPFLWFFGAALFAGQTFLFRDAAHYYYPLLEWTAGQWGAGRLPLWNPQDSGGMPLVADTTSGVFYPGKLLLALPLDYATRYTWYIGLHVLLAAAGAFALARHWQASRLAAGLGAVAYAFGGNVLFQYCNVVFLVGAAWLPLALLATDRMLCRRSAGWAVVLGGVLALMTLGGDPQTAYHAGLLAVLYAWLLRRQPAEQAPPAASQGAAGRVGLLGDARLHRLRTHRFSLLTMAAVSGGLLASVQILPAAQWTGHSARAAYSVPRSVYEIPEYLVRPPPAPEDPADGRACPASASRWMEAGRGLWGRPEPGTHHEQIYQFSVGPWRLAELLWPNVSGRLFPVYHRWTAVIPAEGRLWTPSLYMGLLPLLLALGTWRLRRAAGPPHVRWLSWSVLLAVLGSFGWYGLGWLLHELRHSLLAAEGGQDPLVGQPVGGLYWLLVVLLPGYAYFRYPAKLLVVAALGLSLLAARGWDRAWIDPAPLRRALAGCGLLSLLAAAVTLSLRPFWDGLQQVPADGLFGPLDVHGAMADVLRALVHTLLLCGVLGWIFRYSRRERRRRATGAGGVQHPAARPGWVRWFEWPRRLVLRRAVLAPLALLITAVDLAAANGWMVPTAPAALWKRPAALAEQIAAAEARRDENDSPYRVFRASSAHWLPQQWAETSSADRQVQGLLWDRATLFPKYHLQTQRALVESSGTLSSHDLQTVLKVARRYGPRRPDGVAEPHPAVLDALSARYLLLPEGFVYPRTEPLDPAAGRPVENAAAWYNPGHLPRAWIVGQVETLPPLGGRDPAAVRRRTEQVFFPHGQPRDLRRQAVVETDLPLRPNLDQATVADDSWCRIVRDEPQRVELEVHLTGPGLVVLNDLYYPGWTAHVATRSADRRSLDQEKPSPIYRTNRIMRGIHLPAGQHRVVYRYRPLRLYFGAAVSALACVALIVGLLGVPQGRGPPSGPSRSA